MSQLEQLASLLAKRNAIDKEISDLISRPALKGHVGEWIAQESFGVKLEESAAQKGFDGRFADGPLAGKTVNVKWYGKREGILDINPDGVPDHYLVMTGPKAAAMTSRGQTLPWVITEVFLFDAPASRPASATTPGLLGAAALTGFILILPSPEGLPPEAHRLAALFAGVLVLWSTEALPIAVTALLALALQPLFGLTSLVTGRPPTPGAIFGAAAANFMSSVFFFVLVMFAIAHAWVKTGLARRFALWLIARAGTDATRAVYVFMIGTGAISMVVSDVPAAAIFMAIAVGILDKLGLRPRIALRPGGDDRDPHRGPSSAGSARRPGSSINLLGLVMIEQAGGDRVPFLHWMAIGIPMVAILLPVAAWVLLRFFPPEIASIGDLEEIHDERRRMGPVSRAEWKVVAIMSAMITLWIASTWLPVFDTFLVAVVGAVAMFLPGIGLFTWKEVQQVTGWDTLMVIGGVTSLGQASSQTGLATWLAESALGGLADWHAVALIAAISAFTVVIHLMLPIAPVINAVMIPPIMVLGAAAGVNPALLRAAGHLHRVMRLPPAARRRAPRHLQPGLLPDVRHAARRSRHQRRVGGADDGAADRDRPVGGIVIDGRAALVLRGDDSLELDAYLRPHSQEIQHDDGRLDAVFRHVQFDLSGDLDTRSGRRQRAREAHPPS